jgi:primosomal protein N'
MQMFVKAANLNMQVQTFQICKFLLIERKNHKSANFSGEQSANSKSSNFPPFSNHFIVELSGRRFVWPNFLFYKNSK